MTAQWRGWRGQQQDPGLLCTRGCLGAGSTRCKIWAAQISGSTACCEDVQAKPTCGSWEGASMGPRLVRQLLPGPLGPISGVLSVKGDNDGSMRIEQNASHNRSVKQSVYITAWHVAQELSRYKRACVLSHSVMSDSLRPMDCSPPGSSVHGILQARILEWVAIPFSRGSS